MKGVSHGIKVKSRDSFVRASFERINAMGKGRAIMSDKDRSKRERSFRKKEYLRETKRSSYDDGSFFIFVFPVMYTKRDIAS
jgi:hypothetical protein